MMGGDKFTRFEGLSTVPCVIKTFIISVEYFNFASVRVFSALDANYFIILWRNLLHQGSSRALPVGQEPKASSSPSKSIVIGLTDQIIG